MKRILIIFSITIVSLIIYCQNAYALSSSSTYRYSWKNTVIDIPVGSAFDDYKDLPKATLYIDDYLASDAEISYNTLGDWLYYAEDVDTSKCGTYKVWYKAYEKKYMPGTCTNYKSLITFNVIDNINPTISIIDKEVVVKRGNTYDLSKNIVVSDNYTKNADLDIRITSNVDFDIVGIYPVNVIVKDLSGNYSKDTFDVIVYEESKPVITSSKSVIKIPYKNDNYDISKFFTAVDQIDKDLSSKIYYPKLNNDTIGSYEYKVSVTNSSNITAELSVTIEVVDEVEPTLLLSTNSLVLDYNTDFDTYDFFDNVKYINDNQPINYDNLVYSTNLENKVGSYYIWYSYNDGMFTVSDSIEVRLLSFAPPIIEVPEVIRFTMGTNIDLKDFITVSDLSDPNIYSSLTINDSGVDYNSEGTYDAYAFTMNSSGLITEKKFIVKVESESIFSEEKRGSSITIILLVIFLLIFLLGFGLAIFFIVYKKRKRKDARDKKKSKKKKKIKEKN